MTTKGTDVGSEGRVVKMIVVISYGKGVIYCTISSLSITYHIMKLSYGKEIRGLLW